MEVDRSKYQTNRQPVFPLTTHQTRSSEDDTESPQTTPAAYHKNLSSFHQIKWCKLKKRGGNILHNYYTILPQYLKIV